MPTRRDFLATLAATGFGPCLDRTMARRRTGYRLMFSPRSTGRVLVIINLQGAYDALSLLPPIGVSPLVDRYVANRPRLSTRSGPGSYLPLVGVTGFGLHPALGVIQNEFNAGDCAIVQQVGLPGAELSHFQAMEIMGKGRADLTNPNQTGWLGRLADGYFSTVLDVIGLGIPNRIEFNAQTVKPLVIGNLQQFGSFGFLSSQDQALRRDILDQMSSQLFGGEARLTAAARRASDAGFEAATALAQATASISIPQSYDYSGSYVFPGNFQPPEALAASLKDIAKMILAPSVGTRVFTTWGVDFDTHGRQENVVLGLDPQIGDRQSLTERLHLTMAAIGGFIQTLKANNKWNSTAIVLTTEFGRRNYENETNGTDHGRGFHAFVLGGLVNGGLKGPSVTAADIDPAVNENLPVRIDYREVFKQCIENWLQLPPVPPNPGTTPVFNDYLPLPGQPSITLF